MGNNISGNSGKLKQNYTSWRYKLPDMRPNEIGKTRSYVPTSRDKYYAFADVDGKWSGEVIESEMKEIIQIWPEYCLENPPVNAKYVYECEFPGGSFITETLCKNKYTQYRLPDGELLEPLKCHGASDVNIYYEASNVHLKNKQKLEG